MTFKCLTRLIHIILYGSILNSYISKMILKSMKVPDIIMNQLDEFNMIQETLIDDIKVLIADKFKED